MSPDSEVFGIRDSESELLIKFVERQFGEVLSVGSSSFVQDPVLVGILGTSSRTFNCEVLLDLPVSSINRMELGALEDRSTKQALVSSCYTYVISK